MAKPGMKIDMVALIKKMAAIYFHVELDEKPSFETLASWRQEIETNMTLVCGEIFDLDPNSIELEIVLVEGSLWAKLEPTLRTIGLILSLYNGVHSLPENLMSDYQRFSESGKTVIEEVTKGQVNRIQGPWDNSEVLQEVVQRVDPTSRPSDASES